MKNRLWPNVLIGLMCLCIKAIAKENRWCDTPKFPTNTQALKFARKTLMFPKSISGFYKASPSVFTIDINGDKKNDFIAHSSQCGKTACPEGKLSSSFCIFDDKGRRRYCEKSGHFKTDFTYCFFTQLDNDPALELLIFSGHADSQNQYAYKFNQNFKKTKIFEFIPLINNGSQEKLNLHRGKAKNITGIFSQQGKFLTTTAHKWGNCVPQNAKDTSCLLDDPEDRYKPVIIFSGKSDTKGRMPELAYLNSLLEYQTLDEIQKQLREFK